MTPVPPTPGQPGSGPPGSGPPGSGPPGSGPPGSGPPTPAAVCDGGPLDCNSGLLIAIRRALSGIAVGEVLEIRSEAPSVAIDLPAWCDLAGHPLEHVTRNGSAASYLVRKGR